MPDSESSANPVPPEAPSTPGYLRPYAEATKRHGPRFEATLWQNEQKQADRFRVLSEMIEMRERLILDAGAGLGDMAHWLWSNRVRYRGFIGIEGVPELAHKATTRRLKRAAFVVEDFAADATAFAPREWPGQPGNAEAQPPDIIVFSGSLNTFKLPDALPILQRAWESARAGIAFNFLNARHRPGINDSGTGQPAWRFDPFQLLDWAMEQTSKVRYRQDYFDGHDATITMERW